MHRTRPFLLCLFATLAAATPAAAAPRVVSAVVEGDAVGGSGLTVAVVAADRAQPVTGVRVTGPDGMFAESACRLERDGSPFRAGAFEPGRRVRFAVPYRPTAPGLHRLTVTVVSGGCGATSREASVPLAFNVKLPALSPLPKLPVARTSGRGCAGADAVPRAGTLRRARAATLCLMNAQRRGRGLPRLRASRDLRRAATRHSRDMLRRRFFDHAGPHGPTLAARLARVGFWPAVASENLGVAVPGAATPAAMVAAWMRSDPHRANILAPSFAHAGVGVVAGLPTGGRGATYTVDFGRR